MLTNGDITIYHFDEDTEQYKPCQYKGVNLYRYSKVIGTNGGFTTANLCKIRISTAKKINISCSDYVYAGLTSGKLDKSKCLKVFAFSDNRRGSLKHWRIDCQ